MLARWNKGLFYTCSAVACVFTLFLAIELLLVLTNRSYRSGTSFDPSLGWRLVKDSKWTLDVHYGSNLGPRKINISTNSWGFRDIEHDFNKQPHSKRLLILGDSYIAGLQVSDEETFSSKLAHRLGERIEVINTGVSAWSTDQQFKYFRDEGVKLAPDKVLLMIAPNDIRESVGKGFFSLSSDGELLEQSVSGRVPFVERLFWSISNISLAFNAFSNWGGVKYGSFDRIFTFYPPTFSLTSSRPCTDEDLFRVEVPPELRSARKLFEKLVTKMMEIATARKIQLILSVTPTKLEFEGLKKRGYQAGLISSYVKKFAQSHGLQFIDLNESFNHFPRPLDFFIENEYHLTPQGHAMVASVLATQLED